jgi:hypothetical protein
MAEEGLPIRRKMMKMFLLLALASVVTAGALPSLPAKVILSAFVILAALSEGIRRASKHRKNHSHFLLEQ